jgi:hypothetical protein
MATRNDSLEFAERTRKNLDFILAASSRGEDVHPITQLIGAMLGLIVFPWEGQVRGRFASLSLQELEADGWPHWNIELGQCTTLDDMVRLLRNAVAHGHVRFSSDGRILDEVSVRFESRKPSSKKPDFAASVSCRDLYGFCTHFTDLVGNVLG